MFNRDFYPTPKNVFDIMIEGESLNGKVVYDPQGGKGNLVVFAQAEGAAQVIASELDPELKKILQTKCTVIGDDFFKVEAHQISHVNYIIMNPPFSTGDAHIAHAYRIAPDGCKIISLCNHATLKNPYSKTRQEVVELVNMYGDSQNLGDCFSTSERKTDVEVGLVKLQKPGTDYDAEFAGFFLEDEAEEQTGAGIMSYNAVRDLVNRYVECIKIYDQQLETAVKLNTMRNGYFSGTDLSISTTRNNVPVARNDFKKEMQKSGWQWIFNKMNLQKVATKGLKEDINKFVEQQTNVPFTMRNIYRMLEIVIATSGQRMDKAILEVFENVTKHAAENRHNVEGWKTNSQYLLSKRFIVPHLISVGWEGKMDYTYSSGGNNQMVEDLVKALCYVTGRNYSDMISLSDFIQYPYLIVKDGKYLNNPGYDFDVKYKSRAYDPTAYGDEISYGLKKFPGSEIQHNEIEWGKWFNWGFFKCRAYKKGTMHFEFNDEDVWATFNQRVAKLKGYPLPEQQKKKTAYQERTHSFQKKGEVKKPVEKKKPVILSTIKFKVAA